MQARAMRYWHSLCSFWSSSLEAEMEYQLNALVELLSVLGNLAGSVFVLGLLAGPRGQIGGWSWDAALLVLGIYTVLDGVSSCLLQPNLSQIVSHVQNGTLDFVLLKPIDSQFWLSTRSFSPWGLPGLVAGLALMAWAALQQSAKVTGASVLLTGALLLAALLILYSLWFLLASLSIWFVKIWNATEVLRYLLVAGRYPVQAYPPGLRILFTFVLPVAFLTTVPAQALLGEASWLWSLASVAVAGACLMGTRLFWRFALRHYTSASS